MIIGERGEPIETRVSRAGSESRWSQRIRSIADWRYSCEASYGLMRMSALREVRPQMNHVHSDRVVLSELALRRPFVLLEEPLFYKRIYEQSAYADPRGRMVWYQPELARTGGIRLPHWQQAGDYVAMLGRSRMGIADRAIAPWNSSGAIGTCGATWPSMRWTACGWRPAGGRHGDVATTAESPRHRMTLEASSSEPIGDVLHVVAAPSCALIRGVVTDNLRSVDRLRWYPSLLLEGSDRDAEQRRLATRHV